MEQNHDKSSHQDKTQMLLYALNIKPVHAFQEFSKKYQMMHPNVRLTTILQNNHNQTRFLNHFYDNVIRKFKDHPSLTNNEEYAAVLSYFYEHMNNVDRYHDYAHSNNGSKQTKDGAEARIASFHFCVQELMPQIQKILRPLTLDV